MKKLIIVIVIICFFDAVKAQQNMLSSSALDVGVGVSGSGLNVNLGISYVLSRKAQLVTSVGTSIGQYKSVVYNPYFLESRLVYSITAGNSRYKSRLLNKASGLVSTIGGIIVQYDRINKDFQLEEGKNNDAFNVGVEAGLEMSFVVSRDLNIYVNGVQKYFMKEDFGHWRFQVAVGMRKTL